MSNTNTPQIARFFERGWNRAWDNHPAKHEYIAKRLAECTFRRVIATADEIFWSLHPSAASQPPNVPSQTMGSEPEASTSLEQSPNAQCSTAPVNSARAVDVKALHDALLTARLALRVLIPKLLNGERISNPILTSLQDQYCGQECPIDSLDVVIKSREQFDELAKENASLRAENKRIKNQLKVAREERDELLQAKPR